MTLRRTSTLSRKRKPTRRAADPVAPETYAAVMQRYGGRCVGAAFGPCAGTHHWHHRLPVQKGGPSTVQNGLRLCARHHDWTHQHPEEARTRGWLLRAWQEPGEVAVTLAGPPLRRFAVLDEDGGMTEVTV